MAPVRWEMEYDPDDKMAPAKGILRGVLLGTVSWIVIMAILYGLYVWYEVQT